METKSTQQEILLFTNTTFSSRQWMDKGVAEKLNNMTPLEKLEEACWNGLVHEVLPEICETPTDVKMTLWEVNVANSFLDLKFSQFPEYVEKDFSIDPYIFIPVQVMN